MPDDLLKLLEQSPFLSAAQLSIEDLQLIHFSAGDRVYDSIHETKSIGYIISGQIDVYTLAIDGHDVQINSLMPHESFGISNLFSDAELETILKCKTKTSIIYIPKQLLLKQMEENSFLAIQYAKLCNEKLQFLIHRIESLTIQSCRGKLIAYLISEKDTMNQVISTRSKEQLASYLGVSRAALFRELSFLQSQGALTLQKSKFTITDLDMLHQLLYQSPL